MGERAWALTRVCVVLAIVLVPLAFDPSRDEVFAPIKLQVLQVLLAVALVSAAVGIMTVGAIRFRPLASVDLPVAAFTVLNLLAYRHSLDRAASLRGQFPEYQGLTTILAYVAIYALARLSFSRRRELAELFALLTVVAAVIGGYAVLQRLGLDPLWGVSRRPFASIGQANSLAAMLVVALPAALWTALHCSASFTSTAELTSAAEPKGGAELKVWVRRGLCVGAWVAVFLGALGLFVSLSRGGWIAALSAAACALWFVGRDLRRVAVRALVPGFAVLLLLLMVVPAGRAVGADAVKRVQALGAEDGSTGEHVVLWKVGLGLSRAYPWLGTGQEVFPQLAQGYADENLPEAEAARLRPYLPESPHNALLSISVGAGLITLLAYLAFLAAAAARLRAVRRRGDLMAVPVLAMLVGYVTAGLFVTPEVSSSVAMWGVLGAACAALGRGPVI